jgi:amidase
MKRRTFLGSTVGATAAIGGLAGCKTAPGDEPIPPFELEEFALADLADGLKSGRWTARKLVELYLARIDALNHKGPSLAAVIEVNPDALSIADQLDKSSAARGPLHGIPILIKDNIDTADKMSTSAGSLALEHSHPSKDSDVAQRLRAAGAVIIGKTNLSEWANIRSTHSISGWSGRGGQTRNPYALDRNPSGSSSGSAAAAASCMCAAAIGTETDGSIVSPSSVNGLVGIKPTVGLIGGSGIIPISHSQDTAGPMARNVEDAAMLLTALANNGKDYTHFLDAKGLKGVRLGVARKFFENNAPLNKFLTNCVEQLVEAGAEIVDPADLPSHGKLGEPENTVLMYELKADMNAYLAGLPAGPGPRTLADLIDFNEKNRSREMPLFDQELFIQAQSKGPLTDDEYLQARADCLRLSRDEGIDAVISRHAVDAIVCLTNGPGWLIDDVNGDYDTGGCSTPAAVAGYPHITVPAGLFRGLPVGLSFFGGANQEGMLFRLAYGWEQTAKARRKPAYLPRLPAAIA